MDELERRSEVLKLKMAARLKHSCRQTDREREKGRGFLPGCWGSGSPRLHAPARGRSSDPGRRLRGPRQVQVGGHLAAWTSGVWMLEVQQEESAAGSPVGAAPGSDCPSLV